MFISENYCPSSSSKSDSSRIDNPLAMLRDHDGDGEFSSGEVFVFTKDHLRSVRDLTDHNQKLIQRYNYSAYGKTKLERIAGGADIRFVENYFTHAAREWEPEVGIICNRGRCHDMNGRWLSEDPIGFDGGDQNLYRYIENNPINATDPMGIAKICKTSIDAVGLSSSLGGDFLNLEPVHEHIYYEDKQGGDIGFFPAGDSLFGDGVWTSGNSGGAKSCESKSYNDKSLREAVKNVSSQNNSYNLIPVFGNNCQSAMDRVRDQYKAIEHKK